MLEFFLWVIFIYFVIMLVWRYAIPFLLKRFVRKMDRRFQQMQGEEGTEGNHRKEGEVSIHQMPPEKRNPESPPQDVEYTDFEEVKDDNEPK